MRNTGETFYGSKLNLLRTYHGFTLEDLSKKVGVSRQYLQRLESDYRTEPTDEMLDVLAEILNASPSFFRTPILNEIHETACFFRKQKTTPSKVKRTAISNGILFGYLIHFLEDHVDIPDIDFPEFTVTLNEDIERAAEKCRVKWGLLIDAPIHNMVRVIESFGGVVTTFEGMSGKIDAFSFKTVRPVVVRSDYKKSTSRARFDIAHELGHIVMHEGLEPDSEDFIENQANRFAAAFLLPRTAFCREFVKTWQGISWNNVFALKKRWGVSLQLIIRRAYDLGLISAAEYRQANIYIVKRGWRTCEPIEDSIPYESPETINDAIELLSVQGLSGAVIADKIGIGLPILKSLGIKFSEPASDNTNNVVYLKMYDK